MQRRDIKKIKINFLHNILLNYMWWLLYISEQKNNFENIVEIRPLYKRMCISTETLYNIHMVFWYIFSNIDSFHYLL